MQKRFGLLERFQLNQIPLDSFANFGVIAIKSNQRASTGLTAIFKLNTS